MKIGIITFQRAQNYGAVLQAFALKTYLKSLGHEVSVVDYRSAAIEDGYKIFDLRKLIVKNPKKLIYRNLKFIRTLSTSIKRSKAFNKFILDHLSLSSTAEMASFDIFVIGSDQVWNPVITRGYDPLFFGLFDKGDTQRVISYAASAGWAEKDLDLAVMKNALGHFERVSVREDSLRALLAPLVSGGVQTVVDPTLLLGVEQWGKIAERPNNIPDRYLLMYQMFPCDNSERIAHEIADKLGIKVIEIDGYVRKKATDTFLSACRIEEFVWLFKNAEFVVTSSFHGTAFSLINSIPFYAIEVDGEANNRVRSLLAKLNLSDRIIDEHQSVEPHDIDYNKVQPLLNSITETSKDYLRGL